MGGSQSCCPDDSSRKEVLVMKEDGEPIRFKEGTAVKDVLAAHPYHKVIRCCSDHAVLPETFQLNGTWLYFLLPEGLAVNDATYQSLIRSAVSKELIVSKLAMSAVSKELIVSKLSTNRTAAAENKVVVGCDGDSGCKRSLWKPALRTIEEVTTSPPLRTDV